MKLTDVMNLQVEVQRLIPEIGMWQLFRIVKLILDKMIAQGYGDKTIKDIRAMLP